MEGQILTPVDARILGPETRPRNIPGSNIELSKDKLVIPKWVTESRRFLILNSSLESYMGPIWTVGAIIARAMYRSKWGSGQDFLLRSRVTSSR